MTKIVNSEKFRFKMSRDIYVKNKVYEKFKKEIQLEVEVIGE